VFFTGMQSAGKEATEMAKGVIHSFVTQSVADL
jgi:hypothetical protein